MTEKAPTTLDRLWDSIPTESAPIHDLLTAGHTASRRRRNTRLVGVAAFAAVLVGGVATQQAITSPSGNQSGDLAADAGRAATDQSAPNNVGTAHPCPDSQRSPVALDIPGPGRLTPQEAVAPYIVGSALVISEDAHSATIMELAGYGSATRVFEVTKREDGWWPDTYVVCDLPQDDGPESSNG